MNMIINFYILGALILIAGILLALLSKKQS